MEVGDLSIETVIFDFGNVIAHFDYRIAANRLGEPLGLSGERLMERATSLGFRNLLMDFESGRVGPDAFVAELKVRLGLPQSPSQITADWADIFTANEPVHALAHELGDSGVKLVLGSNTNAIHASHFVRQFDSLLSRFESLVFSHEVGAMKPADAFYRRCVEVSGSPAARCVFIDDMLENVEGAKAAGLQALHFDNAVKLKADLLALGLPLNRPKV
ncbi:HAD-IA family hydrolase [bacterium]|nr:HAD-IA family hydrolase [bacterium]